MHSGKYPMRRGRTVLPFNWLLLTDGVIYPRFGDMKAVASASDNIIGLYKDYRVNTVRLDQLPYLVEGIHCFTEEVPA
jgi:agmatine/peptidylarginine deiminase